MAQRKKTVSVNSMFYFGRDVFGGLYAPRYKEEKLFPFTSDNFSQEVFHITVLFLYWIKHMSLYPHSVYLCIFQLKEIK